MSWGISVVAKGTDLKQTVASKLEDTRKYNSEIVKVMLEKIASLTEGLEEMYPDNFITFDTNGHLEPHFAGSFTVSVKVYPR